MSAVIDKLADKLKTDHTGTTERSIHKKVFYIPKVSHCQTVCFQTRKVNTLLRVFTPLYSQNCQDFPFHYKLGCSKNLELLEVSEA